MTNVSTDPSGGNRSGSQTGGEGRRPRRPHPRPGVPSQGHRAPRRAAAGFGRLTPRGHQPSRALRRALEGRRPRRPRPPATGWRHRHLRLQPGRIWRAYLYEV
jgi:hypothetical protein